MTNVTIIGAADSDTFDFGGFGVSWKVPGGSTGGRSGRAGQAWVRGESDVRVNRSPWWSRSTGSPASSS